MVGFQRAWDSTPNKLWISKPPLASLSRGIQVLTHWNQIPDTLYRRRRRLVQKYVSNPYLHDSLKVELRIFFLVTSISPLRVYTFPENLRIKVGMSNFTADPESRDDLCVHGQDYVVGEKEDCDRRGLPQAYASEMEHIMEQLYR
jgi:tubulin polyglutamylase TTLL6/13